ncbi:MAG: pyrroline-5-carboxylate reductase [Lachnospiraceae bacterium]|nr:pyrroline-5-carboxylate reductase [Lachnospiraceae bacterium]
MKIGFLGMGNMAQAIAEGWVKKGLVQAQDMCAYAPHQEKLIANAERIGYTPMESAAAMVGASDVIVIACKPYQIKAGLKELRLALIGKSLWSLAAGWTCDMFESLFIELGLNADSVHVQCVMPNTPALVGEGVFLFEETNSLVPTELTEMKRLFSGLGVVETLPTAQMGIGGAISGCGPAFVDLFMEAYADAAVKYGISRPTAYKIVAQTVLGSAKLQIETGQHPAVLKDAVCSPSGTTICGVAALEKAGFRSACIECIDAIMNKKKNG